MFTLANPFFHVGRHQLSLTPGLFLHLSPEGKSKLSAPRVWEELNTSSSTFSSLLSPDLCACLQKVLSGLLSYHTGALGCPAVPVTGRISLILGWRSGKLAQPQL